MKVTAAIISMFAALIVASASDSGAFKQAIGGTLAFPGTSTAQTTPDVRDADQTSCAKWRQFSSSFSLKPAGSNRDKSPDGSSAAC
ncbi:MAG: hypothetical protein AAF249_15065 [Pseudomonadota bacterium]